MNVSTRNRVAVALLLLVAAAAPFAGVLARGEVPTFRDHESYFLPLRWHTAEALRAGDLPLWNPWNGGGEPWLANPQTGVFYPPAWLFLVLPFSLAYSVFLILHLAILGWGAWTLFRRWAAEGPALTAAIALMLSGPVFSLLDINNNLTSFSWLPLVFRLAAEREEKRTAGPLCALIGALALAFLGGEPLYAAIGALATLAILLPRDWRGAIVAGAGSAALTAVQLLPFLAWIAGSERAVGLDPDEAFRHAVGAGDWLALAIPMASASGTVEPLRLVQQFVPSFYLG
ncbi:MAG: glycosyltransferase 87 family protein, partial [Thermoanaerobaculia bacterium]